MADEDIKAGVLAWLQQVVVLAPNERVTIQRSLEGEWCIRIRDTEGGLCSSSYHQKLSNTYDAILLALENVETVE